MIQTWLSYKREREVDAIALRPHPYEFYLYYDTIRILAGSFDTSANDTCSRMTVSKTVETHYGVVDADMLIGLQGNLHL